MAVFAHTGDYNYCNLKECYFIPLLREKTPAGVIGFFREELGDWKDEDEKKEVMEILKR